MKNEKGSAEEYFARFGSKIDDCLRRIQSNEMISDLDLSGRINELKKDGKSLSSSFSKFKKEHEEDFVNIQNSLNESFTSFKDLFKNRNKRAF